MKDYVVNNFKATYLQYAMGQLFTCIDLEECRIKTTMFEKYPSISPYTYCANNPMKYVDPTGKEVEIICPVTGNKIPYTPGMAIPEGASKFVLDAITGLDFLYNNPEGELNRVGELVNSKVKTTIVQQNSNLSSQYSGASNKLQFENTMIDDFGDGLQAPIIGLAHEIDHAYISVKAWESVFEFEANETPSTNIDYMNSVETAYMFSDTPKKDQWEASAIKYENFIATKTYEGKPISTCQRQNHTAPISRYFTNSIFSITR